MEVKKVSKEEFERIKKLVEAQQMEKKIRELSDEDLDKVAGGVFNDLKGYFCDPGTIPFGNACISEDEEW